VWRRRGWNRQAKQTVEKITVPLANRRSFPILQCVSVVELEPGHPCFSQISLLLPAEGTAWLTRDEGSVVL